MVRHGTENGITYLCIREKSPIFRPWGSTNSVHMSAGRMVPAGRWEEVCIGCGKYALGVEGVNSGRYCVLGKCFGLVIL